MEHVGGRYLLLTCHSDTLSGTQNQATPGVTWLCSLSVGESVRSNPLPPFHHIVGDHKAAYSQ